jgi:predicted kinase
MYILLIGPPGSGKTTFANLIKHSARREVSLVNDRDLLLQMSEDPQYSVLLNRTGDNSFSVIDSRIYDIALAAFGRKIRNDYCTGADACVEFSRNDYRSAVSVLSHHLDLSNSPHVYMNCADRIRSARNKERSRLVGGYSVPEEEMASYFARDDYIHLEKAFSHRFYSISNDASLAMLVAKAKELCERLNI